jgi:hypothetical protein
MIGLTWPRDRSSEAGPGLGGDQATVGLCEAQPAQHDHESLPGEGDRDRPAISHLGDPCLLRALDLPRSRARPARLIDGLQQPSGRNPIQTDAEVHNK